jgi:hypothetical protein
MSLSVTEGHCHEQLLQRPGPMFQAMLVSRAALQLAGGLDPRCPSYQEWDTAIRLSRHCRFVHLHEPLFVWVRHPGETISHDQRRAVRGFDYVIASHRDDIVQRLGARAWRRLRLDNVARAMQAGLWDEAEAQLRAEAGGLGHALARVLVRCRRAPRGLGRGLRLLA